MCWAARHRLLPPPGPSKQCWGWPRQDQATVQPLDRACANHGGKSHRLLSIRVRDPTPKRNRGETDPPCILLPVMVCSPVSPSVPKLLGCHGDIAVLSLRDSRQGRCKVRRVEKTSPASGDVAPAVRREMTSLRRRRRSTQRQPPTCPLRVGPASVGDSSSSFPWDPGTAVLPRHPQQPAEAGSGAAPTAPSETGDSSQAALPGSARVQRA